MSAISPLRGVAVPSALSNERRLETRLWLLQRVSALVLAGCVIVHLITIIYAVRSGLSAATILGRLRGSLPWMAFYGVFVVAVALHVPIGLRSIAAEWLGLRGRFLNPATFFIGALLLALGVRALVGIFGGAA